MHCRPKATLHEHTMRSINIFKVKGQEIDVVPSVRPCFRTSALVDHGLVRLLSAYLQSLHEQLPCKAFSDLILGAETTSCSLSRLPIVKYRGQS